MSFQAAPIICASVAWDMRGKDAGKPDWWATDVGDLLWNPKGAEGHVLVAEVRCGEMHNGRRVDCGCGGWAGPCTSTTLVCECGEDGSWRDHHYEILARAANEA